MGIIHIPSTHSGDGNTVLGWHQSPTIQGHDQPEMQAGGALPSTRAIMETASADCAAEPGTGRVVIRRVDELKSHPDFAKHRCGPPIQSLSVLSSRGEVAFQEPITITQDGLIVKGYALWHLALQQKRDTVLCLERQMTQQEALLNLIWDHRRSNGLNDFVRVLLALELEPWFQRRAKSNQRVGGRLKGLSNLTEVDRIDVREEIASAAGVSTGNVTKVRQLQACAAPELIEAVRTGEVSIDRAWKWSKSSASSQRDSVRWYRAQRGVHITIRSLIAKHRSECDRASVGLRDILRGIAALRDDERLTPLAASIEQLIAEIERISALSEGETNGE